MIDPTRVRLDEDLFLLPSRKQRDEVHFKPAMTNRSESVRPYP